MANQKTLSNKHQQIIKSVNTMVIIMAVSAFITVFSLVSAKALLSQRAYKSKVIKEKKLALSTLKKNNKVANELAESYKVFISNPENVIGGSTTGSSDRDGDNGKIVLDALPSKYDFPALATSLDKILSGKSFSLVSITGIDDEINQQAKSKESKPEIIEIPIQISANGTADSVNELINILEKSIRPIKINKLDIAGADNNLTITVTAKTYYQPQKVIQITTKEVK